MLIKHCLCLSICLDGINSAEEIGPENDSLFDDDYVQNEDGSLFDDDLVQNDDDLSNNQSNSLDDTGAESKGNESSSGFDGGQMPDYITSGLAEALHKKKKHHG